MSDAPNAKTNVFNRDWVARGRRYLELAEMGYDAYDRDNLGDMNFPLMVNYAFAVECFLKSFNCKQKWVADPEGTGKFTCDRGTYIGEDPDEPESGKYRTHRLEWLFDHLPELTREEIYGLGDRTEKINIKQAIEDYFRSNVKLDLRDALGESNHLFISARYPTPQAYHLGKVQCLAIEMDKAVDHVLGLYVPRVVPGNMLFCIKDK